MNLTSEMKRRLIEREIFQREVNIVLGIRPKMEVTRGGCAHSDNPFDLRSLNKNAIKKW
jgi:hypothetical protein